MIIFKYNESDFHECQICWLGWGSKFQSLTLQPKICVISAPIKNDLWCTSWIFNPEKHLYKIRGWLRW